MQISAFKLIDDEELPIYGINISKVKSFEMVENIKITSTFNQNKFLMGIGHIRNDTVSIVNLAEWMGITHLSKNPKEYKYLILCEFNETKIAFVCNKIIRIYSKEATELEKINEIGDDEKITYVTKINLSDELLQNNQKEELCLILDVERMLFDLFPKLVEQKIKNLENLESFKNNGKIILIAEDSQAAINALEKVFEKIDIKSLFFKDGNEIINWLDENKKDGKNIGIIITDLEMPIKDGYRVIDYVKKTDEYKNLPLYAHSSMSNVGAIEKTKSLGVDGFIPKFNPEILLEIIKKHLSI